MAVPQPRMDLPEPIAIVGTGLRFPGQANSRSALWKLLESPPDLCREIPTDRFSSKGFYHHDGARHGSTNVRHSYLLDEDIRVFDAAFFNISANEAESIDPQQRILLETVYEALEAGGHTLESLRGSDTSVYVGTMTVDYLDTLLRDHNTIPKYFATGINRAIISNRVSYFFDWHGPSMTIDTACSSSLIAVHQGVQSLRNGECRVSVACGTQALLGYDMYIGESNLKMLSPNGRSRMWDADADGYARGEGVAAIVMKTLTNALADGDHIECIIRETGANQDGFSNGLTVPSSEAQAALIRRTYLKAGLDPATRPDDRPQYFEAHGTGTQAGDPKEAAAIHDVFGRHHDAKDGKADPLYVGSIKTVIGHLEGAAGLAGLLKASVSLQKGLIPPNRSFHRLNPKIEPFYHGLHVPTAVTAWPSIPDGVPRRASVNSFGFGGANAHAILEAYSPATQAISPSEDTQTKISFAPYVFSASTETSLVALLEKYSQGLRSRLDSGEQIDRSDLAWTLHSRRTRFPVRVSFPASSVQDLVTGIGSKIAAAKSNSGTPVGFRSSGKAPTPRILGIFTGQGAQWPAMGASLIRSSSLVSEIVDRLDDALSSLPLSDRPEWSLRTEMLAGVGTSRISEAALSQPLCTALQIILVDILREAGIKFSSVVGHSSGEIAAAYAAGFFSARDAMRIAYYRGLFAKLSGNEQNGQKGAMLAVGSSYEDARDFINSDVFKGRLAVAAHNSSASVTLSGDADAIIEAKAMLDKKKVFARLLKVDTAYHSHHMSPCSDVYIEALRACEIKVNHERDTTCSWFSSVIPGAKVMHSTDEVECIYWKDNMVNTVLFAEAVGKAIQNDEHINMVLEVGPHPALKGPATQSIGDLRPSPLPYSGLLSRGTDDVTALSDAFGFLWTMFAADSVNLASFDRALSGASQSRKLMVDLPVYQWDHGRVHWSESRKSKRIRERTDAPHELLGVSSPESNSHDMRWTNILKADEIGWMEGHKLQGLIVFPAAGYVAMALEACRKLTGVDAVQLIEMNDLSIPKAVTFPEGDTSGVETLVTLTKIEHHSDETITADFSLYAGPNVSTGSNHNLELTASASMKVILGNPDFEALPYSVAADESNMSEVDPDRIYAAFSKLGYGYSAAFKGLSSTKRKLNKASALVDTYKYAEDDSTFYMVHPSMLDVAIQSAMLAYASPGDGRLWSLHVPTGIRSIRVNPSVCSSLSISGGRVPIVTSLGESSEFSASIDILSEDGRHGMIQVEDMVLKPFAPATEADDRWMFTATTLGNATPDALSLTELPDTQSASRRAELDAVCERISRYFLRKWRSEITDDDWEKTPEPHNRQFRDFIDSAVSGSTRAYSEDAWINDTDRDIELLVSKYSSERSVKLFSAVAQMLPEIVRGHSTIRDPMGVDGLLDHFCSRDLEYTSSQLLLAGMVKQITFRYPHARILEIGTGDGDATNVIHESIKNHGGAVPSYTYTAPSVEAVENASKRLLPDNSRMTLKQLNLEQSISDQGYDIHSYDIVVGSGISRTANSLLKTLTNIRQLLKPGGYLLLIELTGAESSQFSTTMANLAAWWLGEISDSSRTPVRTSGEWHFLLRTTGFGGIDAISSTVNGSPFSVMVTQAVDEKILSLRRPLSSSPSQGSIRSLVILSGKSLETSQLAEQIADNLARFCGDIKILDRLPTELDASNFDPMTTFVNLVDFAKPMFKTITSIEMDGLKRMFAQARHILWLTRGVFQGEEPYHAASVAFCRSLTNEASHISVNVLDISGVNHDIAKVASEHLLRQCMLEEWDEPNFLWSKEPETYLRNGKLLIPRILPNLDQNARLNSSRRVITKTMPVSSSHFSVLSEANQQPFIVADTPSMKLKQNQAEDIVKVEYSTSKALQVTPGTFLFLASGKTGESDHSVISLAASQSNGVEPIIYLPSEDIGDAIDAALLLFIIAGELFAASLITQVPSGGNILVLCCEKDRYLASALARRATAKSIGVFFSYVAGVSEELHNLEPSWIRLNFHASRHSLRQDLLSVNPTHFLDLTYGFGTGSGLGLRITEVLSANCKQMRPSDATRDNAVLLPSVDRFALKEILENALSGARMSVLSVHSARVNHLEDFHFNLDQFISDPLSQSLKIIHWPVDGKVEVTVQPFDCTNMFSQNKTYVLFGLTGQIGQSLCEWMVSNGAGCVVLTSRRPAVDQRWLDNFKKLKTKATIMVLKADVTDRNSLDDCIATIRATCPPIGGIANGANVLSDTPFESMSAEMMNQALGPKVKGSYNLDQAFFNDNLEFFVLFSSISCVIGTAGQSNYTAANGYLNGLTRQRRSRGFAASAFDIGLILGIGLAEVAGQSVVDSLQKYGITPLSELDVRFAFAESIKHGYVDPRDKEPGSLPAAVMTSGLRTITDDEVHITWYNNPMFSHLVIDSEGEGNSEHLSGNKTASLPVKDKIMAASSMAEASEILKESFSNKLRVVLGSADQAIAHDVPLVELGVDSLIAVEGRSWFLKSLKIDIPVLKMLGGSSVEEISELAMTKLPDDVVSQIGTGTNTPKKPSISEPSKPHSRHDSVDLKDSEPSSSSSSINSESVRGSPFERPASIPTRQTSISSLHISNEETNSNRKFVKQVPISIGQSRFWFLRLLVTDPTTFNVTLKFRMDGQVRFGDLERAVKIVVSRHEALRTCFIEDKYNPDQASQGILARSLVKLEHKTVSSEQEVASEHAQLQKHEFDLAGGALLRMILLTLSPTSHYLLVSYDHIVMDMASFQILTAEIEKAYSGQSLGPSPHQYPEFSVSQRQIIDDGTLDDDFEYWSKVFPQGEQPPILPLLPMAQSNSRPAAVNYTVHQVSTTLDHALNAQIKSICKAQRSTPFHFYLAAFEMLLFSFTDAQELTIGIADANRNESNTIDSIGFFLNLLTLRFQRKSHQKFADAIVEARNTAYGALGHSRLPFDVLLKKLNVARSSSYSPFFQVFFDYRQQTSDRQTWCDCQFNLEELHPGRTAYDISLDVADLGSDIHVTLRVQRDLYDETAANMLLETFTHFVATFAQNPSTPWDEIPRFSEKQLSDAVNLGVGPELISDWPSTLPHRIDEVALANPNNTALIDGSGASLTYAEMYNRIEAIAEVLHNQGVCLGSHVLVFQQATVDWICSMLAIMRIGGVYVPLDLRNPIERLAAQAEHCQPKAVLCDDTTAANASSLNTAIIIDVTLVARQSSRGVPNIANPEKPAAILYTSGSTGTPKGIVIRHSGIRNEMEGYTKTYNLGAERVLQQSAFTFDFSVDQIFTGLVNGGMVYVVPWSKRGDPLSLTEIMREQSITYTKVTPSEYSMWIQYGRENLAQATKWRFAFGGGEPLTNVVLEQFYDLGLENLRLYNSYGPAEISIASHKGFVDYQSKRLSQAPVSCGFSLPNYATYIMDDKQIPVPAGMPGEVVISGAGVSFGYLANSELTSRVFLPNPYATPFQLANGWTRMHRTGDVGHLRQDGSLVFRNRMADDTQVKLRGLRIDLRDIESNIISTAGGVLKDAVVTLRAGDPEYLVAHVVFAGSAKIDDKETFLRQLLVRLPIPQYMVPVLAIPLHTLPLTSHSKMDRKAIKNLSLPRPKSIENAKNDSSEMSQAQISLRQIWRQLLPDSESLGLVMNASTDFFQSGGNSLLVVRLQSRIRQVFDVAIRLADLLSGSTLGQMASKIEESPIVKSIDWESETTPPTVPQFLQDHSMDQEKSDATTILMTGATGNLAKHLLSVLLADERVGKIHCVAVRQIPHQEALFANDKLVFHAGDLSKPLLGLSEDEFRSLAYETDVILHLGAVRSFWDNYNMLRSTNVRATKEIVKLSGLRHIPIHYVSTSAVFPHNASALASSASAAAYQPAMDGSEGYIASKWASERILERAATDPDLAVPSTIYRFLPSSAVEAQSETSKERIKAEFIRCMNLTNTVPSAAGWDGRIDLISGQTFALWFLDALFTTRGTGVQFLHYECPITVQVDELMAWAEEAQQGGKSDEGLLEELPLLQWMGRIKKGSFGFVLAAQDATVRRGEGKIHSRR